MLNGTRPVRPDTRQRVLDAIAQTSYRQDALARALRRSRTDSIGLVVSDAGEPAFAEMMHGVEWAGAELGLTLLLANSAEDAERERKAVQTLLARRVDGLIIARVADSAPDLFAADKLDLTRVVLLDRVFDLPFDQVAAENQGTMRELVTHLFAAGHRRIAVVAGDTRVPSLAERLQGFRDAVEQLDLDPTEQVVIDREANPRMVAARVIDSLGQRGRPTAYVGASSVLAAITLKTFREAGVRTPRDLAFAAFDGFSHSDLFEPQLTTVRQPAYEVGAMAVRLLAARLGGSLTEPRTLRLPARIEYRATTEDYVGA